MADAKAKVVHVGEAEIEIDEAVLDDIDFAEAIADMVSAEDEGDGARALLACTRYFRLLFGGNYKAAKQAVRDSHGGRCTVADMNEVCAAVLAEVGAKN